MKQIRFYLGLVLCILTTQIGSAQNDNDRAMSSKRDQFNRLDQNNDGRISYYEFEQMTPPNRPIEREPRLDRKPTKNDQSTNVDKGKGNGKGQNGKAKGKSGKSKEKGDNDHKQSGNDDSEYRKPNERGDRMDNKTIFSKMDADNNGYVTWEEFNNSKFEGKGKRFGGESSDEDRDDYRDQDKLNKKDKSNSKTGNNRIFGINQFATMDLNGNEKISYGEFKKSDLAKRVENNKERKALFKKLDRNQDGSITENEL